MILTVDLGNSEIGFGLFEGELLKRVFRTKSDRNKTSDEYVATFNNLLGLQPNSKIKAIIISSVVPQLLDRITEALSSITNVNPILIQPGIKTGLRLKMDNPNEIGADLIATAVGAIKRFGYPLIVIDLGTANKMFAVDKDNYFRGGIINPGIRISLEALIRIASQLPNIKLSPPPKVIGTNTVDAMNSGVVYGYARMFDGLINQFQQELGYQCKIIITGGLSGYIKPVMDIKNLIHDPDLIHYGLLEIYLKNKKEGI
jgi:type III pantothenate kinase